MLTVRRKRLLVSTFCAHRKLQGSQITIRRLLVGASFLPSFCKQHLQQPTLLEQKHVGDLKDCPSAEEVRRLFFLLCWHYCASRVALALDAAGITPWGGPWVPFFYPSKVDQLTFSLMPSIYTFRLVMSRFTSWKHLEVSSGPLTYLCCV